MCNFFSCCTKGDGKLIYFNAEERAALRLKNPKNYNPDSHTSIADAHGHQEAKEDKLNKYEFNPLTKKFTVDQINAHDDSAQVEQALLKMNWAQVVPELIIKPIVHPFKVERGPVTAHEIELLKQWNNVVSSVWSSVWNSVENSVGNSVRNSVWDSVWNSVWDSVVSDVRNSAWNSAGNSVRNSVWDSVRNSLWAYISSFFQLDSWKNVKHVPGQNPFQCCIDLWEAGLVPSFDGTVWRLHAGEAAKVVWEGKI